jgi:NAD(P)-dependent dehydrogenase (short-subunit alcohol dehydrogenase family)
MLLTGKVALVAGNATAVGCATAIALSAAGAQVAIGDFDPQPWTITMKTIEATGASVLFRPTDVTIATEVAALVDRTVKTFGKLDVAFNNTSAIAPDILLAEQDEYEVACAIDLNLNGLWLCLKYELAQMLANNGGAIVNNSSVFGLTGYAGGAIYVSTQHAIAGITKAAALDYAQQGIRVNAVAPIPTETEQKLRASSRVPIIPMGRAVRPDEVANAVVWLCSDRASFITGHTLPIDGGFCAQ